jgi:hypothetical protein
LSRTALLVVCVGLSIGLAGEFLGLVPDAAPRDLAGDFRVVGQNRNGVIVVGTDAQQDAFAARFGRFLAGDIDGREYYRVRLIEPASRSDLALVSRVLDFDGDEYVVEIPTGTVENLMKLPAEIGRVSLRGWVFTDRTPKLPRVLANPLIEQLVASVNPDSVLAAVRRLQEYRNRYSTGDSCRAAAQWLKAKFQAYGCDSVILQDHTSGHAPNVIGIKYGTNGQRNPYVIIDGHFDSYAASNAPGADDNASGTVAAVEAARVTQGARFANDLRFIAFSGEEFGLYGSDYYAEQARNQGDSILGVLNFDMIGYVDAAPENLDLLAKISDPPCGPFVAWFTAVADTYTTLACSTQMVSDNQNSDHGPFWNNGYFAFCGIEDFWPTNPHYHTSHDSIGAGYNSNAFCTEVIKAGVAALATLGEPVPLNQPLVGIRGTRIDDATGNNDGFWDAGESVGVYVTMKNFGLVPATSVSATVRTSDPYVTLYDTTASYGTINGGDTALPSAPMTMRAAYGTPREHVAEFDVTIVSSETTWQTGFSLTIGRHLITDPVPDNSQPGPFYYAFDDVDTAYVRNPTYDWVEIRNIGTRLTLSDDQTIPIPVPTPFGPIGFYSQEYSQLSICSNGWVGLGATTVSTYTNTTLPDASLPPMICLNWDDLYPPAGGGVWYYNDTVNDRFIIEYDSIPYYAAQETPEWFELLIYRYGPTHQHFAFCAQYRTASQTNSATIGMQDPTRTVFIQCLYNCAYAPAAAPLVPGRAINYDVPWMAIEEPPTADRHGASPALFLDHGLVVDRTDVRFSLPQSGTAELMVVDQSGRKIAVLAQGRMAAGAHTATWDATRLAGGVYFVRLSTDGRTVTAKAVVAR